MAETSSERTGYLRMLFEDAFTDVCRVDLVDAPLPTPLGVSDVDFDFDGKTFFVTVCVEQVVASTARMDEPGFHDHLLYLRMKAHLQLIFWGHPDEQALILRQLEEFAPGTVAAAHNLLFGDWPN